MVYTAKTVQQFRTEKGSLAQKITAEFGLISTAMGAGAMATTAEDQVTGGIPVIHMIAITAGAVGAKNITLTNKTRILDVHVIMRGAGVASCTCVVGNAANAITNLMDVSPIDKSIVRATTIDDAFYDIAGGGSLRVTTATGATQPAMLVVVTGVLFA